MTPSKDEIWEIGEIQEFLEDSGELFSKWCRILEKAKSLATAYLQAQDELGERKQCPYHKIMGKILCGECRDSLTYNACYDLAVPIIAKHRAELDRMSKSIIEICVKGSEETKFQSVPEMTVAVMRQGKDAEIKRKDEALKLALAYCYKSTNYNPEKEIESALKGV